MEGRGRRSFIHSKQFLDNINFLMGLLEALADERGNKLNKGEYEVTTWSARKWMSFACQQISVALHRAAAAEIAHAMGMSVASDPRSA